MIFKKAVRTDNPQSSYKNNQESQTTRYIESGDKKQSELKCNHFRSLHRARHAVASESYSASCGASACISRRNIECGESGNDLHRSQCVDNPCRCLPQKRLTLDGSIRGDVDVAHQPESLQRSSLLDLAPSLFQMEITSLNRGIYSAGPIPHLGRQKQTPPFNGVNVLSKDRY